MTTATPAGQAPDRTGPALFLLGLVMVGFLLVVWGLDHEAEQPPQDDPPPFQQDRGGERDRDRQDPPRRDRGHGQQAAATGQRSVG